MRKNVVLGLAVTMYYNKTLKMEFDSPSPPPPPKKKKKKKKANMVLESLTWIFEITLANFEDDKINIDLRNLNLFPAG